MAEHGAALQAYNLELVKCVEELKNKRNQILEVIEKEENDKAQLEKSIQSLQSKLSIVDKNLLELKRIFKSYSQTIADAECGFKKILESSKTLLSLVQLETDKIESSHGKKS